MKQYLEIFLGILTAMGGFVEIGELVFSVNAGAKFGFSLLWVVLLGTIGIIVYCEMAGRIAAVTEQPVFYLVRQGAGYTAALGTLIALVFSIPLAFLAARNTTRNGFTWAIGRALRDRRRPGRREEERRDEDSDPAAAI